MKPEEKLKEELAEFESLVHEVRGNCDACSQHCRDRLLILDSQIKALRQVEREYRGTLADMERVIAELKALASINSKLLSIVGAPAGRKAQHKKNRNRDNEKINLRFVAGR